MNEDAHADLPPPPAEVALDEYADEYALNDIGLALRLRALVE